jgi:hypothetical protein
MLQLLVLLCCCLLAHAQESQSTVTLECQVAGLEYQTAPSCTCVHKLPVCPDGCQVRSRPPGRALLGGAPLRRPRPAARSERPRHAAHSPPSVCRYQYRAGGAVILSLRGGLRALPGR